MLDTGASLTLVTQKWANDHGLRVTQAKQLAVKGAGGAGI